MHDGLAGCVRSKGRAVRGGGGVLEALGGIWETKLIPEICRRPSRSRTTVHNFGIYGRPETLAGFVGRRVGNRPSKLSLNADMLLDDCGRHEVGCGAR